ncbi:hypothetical protein [[Eubacterium] cellulosolvens]
MSKRKTFLDSIIETGISSIANIVMANMGTRIQELIHDAVKPIIKKIISGIIGAALITMGILFACISLIKYLSMYIDLWTAWGLVGVVILIIGFLLAMYSIKK